MLLRNEAIDKLITVCDGKQCAPLGNRSGCLLRISPLCCAVMLVSWYVLIKECAVIRCYSVHPYLCV